MPQATDEQRARWHGPDEKTAVRYLTACGYKLQDDWSWLVPLGREPSNSELDAVDFMVNEWDYGGLVYHTCEICTSPMECNAGYYPCDLCDQFLAGPYYGRDPREVAIELVKFLDQEIGL